MALTAAVILSGFAQYLWQYAWPSIPRLRSQPPGVWLFFVLLLICLVQWIMGPWRRAREPWLLAFLALLAVLWALQLILSIVHDDAFNHGVWAYPIVLAMLLLKTPNQIEIRSVLLFSGWLFVAVLVATRALELLRVIPIAPVGDSLIAFEQANYWLPLAGWIGPEGRWPGPFFHNSQTGNIGAYLVVLGVALRRRSGLIFICVGVITLLLTNSRGSWVACAVGVALAVALGPYPLVRRLPRVLVLVGALTLTVVAVGTALAASPNLTGRDAYWADYVKLWQSSPWIGVGITGRNSGPDTIDFVNGHNLVIDALGIFGIFAAGLVAALLAVALIIGAKSALRSDPMALALIVTYEVIGLAQSDYAWMSTSTPWLVLVLAVLLGSADIRELAHQEPVARRSQ